MTNLNVVGAVHALTATLEDAGIEYAISGAIALAYWSAPRATLDIDVALNVPASALPFLLDTLTNSGYELRHDALEAVQRGDFVGRMGGIRIDFFLPVLPISLDALSRRVQVPFGDRDIWILSAEDLMAFKLIFGRTKDFADIERLVAAQCEKLEWNYLQQQLVRIFEPDDSRFLKYLELRKLAGC